MGQTKIKRLKGGNKATKWKRGHSCSTNPTVTLHRDSAKQGMMQRIKNSHLTKDAMVRHVLALNEEQCGPSIPSFKSPAFSVESRSVMDLEKEMQVMAVDEGDDLRSQAKTFASQYTTCSIPAFEDFFDSMTLKNEHQVKMLSFHSTAQKMIKEKGIPENSLSYFLCIITSLEELIDDPQSLAAGLALLVRVIKFVPLRNLRMKYKDFGTILDNVLRKHQDSDNHQLITHVLGCMSILLRAQHIQSWVQDNDLKNWFKNILAFTVHKEPKIRKSGQYNISAVLKGSCFMSCSTIKDLKEEDTMASSKVNEDEEEMETENIKESKPSNCVDIHPAADLVPDFLIGMLNASSGLTSANKRVIHLLVFSRQVIMSFPKFKLQAVIKKLFGLVSLGTGLVNISVMHVLQSLCDASPPESVLTMFVLKYIFTTLTQHSEGMSSAIIAAPHDSQAVKFWSATVQSAVSLAIRRDLKVGIELARKYFEVSLNYLKRENTYVVKMIEESLSSVLGFVYDGLTTQNCDEHTDGIRGIIVNLETALGHTYEFAWPCVFRLLGQCYTELGLYFAPVMMPSLKTLCEMMCGDGITAESDLRTAIGKAVQGIGVEAVYSCAPITITGDLNVDQKNLWMLFVLRKFIRGSRLVIFIKDFEPLARKTSAVIEHLKSQPNANLEVISTYRTVEYQIYGLLPSFAKEAVDVEKAQSNRKFAKLLFDLIGNNERSRIDIMSALRNMILSVEGQECPKLAHNTRNYLKRLFNIYLMTSKSLESDQVKGSVSNSHKHAALETIVVCLTIVGKEVCEQEMAILLKKYEDPNADIAEDAKKLNGKEITHQRTNLLKLAQCFIRYVSSEYIGKLVELIIPAIKTSEKKMTKEQSSCQKASYKTLENILSSESEGTTRFISQQLTYLTRLLVESNSQAARSSRARRLRVAKIILEKLTADTEEESLEHFLRESVTESIACTGRTNSLDCRKHAYAFLTALPAAMKKIKNADDVLTVRECMRLLSCGLYQTTPAMTASTVYAITVFLFLSKDVIPFDLLQWTVNYMSSQLKGPTREVVQACLSYIKGVVSISSPQMLHQLLGTIMDGIVGMKPDCQRKYRIKVNSILSRLMRKLGNEQVGKQIPSSETVLLKKVRNLRKEGNRERRRKEREEQEEQEKEESKNSNDLASEKVPTSLEEILAEIDPDAAGGDDDSDDEGKGPKKNKRRNKASQAWIANDQDSDEDILDFMAPEAASAILRKKPTEKKPFEKKDKEDKEDDLGGFSIDPTTGKLLIVEAEKEKENSNYKVSKDDLDDALNFKSMATSGKISQTKKRRNEISDDEEEEEGEDNNPSKKRKLAKNNFDYGKEFRSKKAKGDVRKKGDKQMPFAYVPMSKETLNKRKQAKFKGQFKKVVAGAKKGSSIGSKKRSHKRD